MTNTPLSIKAALIANVTRKLSDVADGALTTKGYAAFRDHAIHSVKAVVADQLNRQDAVADKHLTLATARQAIRTVQETLNRNSQASRQVLIDGSYDLDFYHELTTGEMREALELICLHDNEGSLSYRLFEKLCYWCDRTHFSSGARKLRRYLRYVAYSFHPESCRDSQGSCHAYLQLEHVHVGKRLTLKKEPFRCDDWQPSDFMSTSEIAHYFRKFCYFAINQRFQRELSPDQKMVLMELVRVARDNPNVKDFIAGEWRNIDELNLSRRVRTRLYEHVVHMVLGRLASVALPFGAT